MSEMLALSSLLRLARDTITDPREGAATVLSVAPPRQALWLMFAIVVVLSLFMGELVALVSGPVAEGPLTDAYSSPLVLGAIQAAFLFIMVYAVHHIGRWMGGAGRFEEALILVVWLQFIFICVQVIQLAAMLVMPPLAPIITIVSMALFMWLLVNFVAVLHGFTSLGMVFVMVLVSGIGILFALSFVLAILGLVPGGGFGQ